MRFGNNFGEHAVLEIEALFALVGLTAGHGVQLTAPVSRLRALVNYSVRGQRWIRACSRLSRTIPLEKTSLRRISRGKGLLPNRPRRKRARRSTFGPRLVAAKDPGAKKAADSRRLKELDDVVGPQVVGSVDRTRLRVSGDYQGGHGRVCAPKSLEHVKPGTIRQQKV